MEHVIAILGLSIMCGLWIVIQRATGRLDQDDEDERASECICGAGQGGSCKSREAGTCERANRKTGE